MRPHYFTTFHLGRDGAPERFDLRDVARIVRRWVVAVRGLAPPEMPDPLPLDDGEKRYDLGPVRLETACVETADLRCAAFRVHHDDADQPDVLWQSDACIVHDGREDEVRVGIASAVGRLAGRAAPLYVPPHRPAIARDLVAAYGGYSIYRFGIGPMIVTAQNERDVVRMIRDPERALPLVYVSVRNADDKPNTDPDLLADQLVGLAHVCVADARWRSHALRDFLRPELGCFDGAIRVYWPGLELDDDPYRHKFWKWDRIAELEQRPERFAGQLLRELGGVSIAQDPEGPVTWPAVQALVARSAIDKALATGEYQEFMKYAEAEMARLTADNRRLSQQLADARIVAERKSDEAEALRIAYQEARRSQGSAASHAAFDAVPPVTVEEAIERAKREFPGRLVFAFNSRAHVAGNPYEDTANLYAALRFLATTYRDARTGEVPCAELDRACREACGFTYEPHQSPTTMGQFPEHYMTQYAGQRLLLEHHLKQGANKDPRYAIRIAFEFYRPEKIVVVGFMGQHQRTRAT